MTELVERAPVAADTVPAAQALLADAITTVLASGAAAKFKPANATPGWQPGAFELAAAIRAALPAGLAADDFDGANIEPILEVTP